MIMGILAGDERVQFKINEFLLDRVRLAKETQNKPIKKGFKGWLKYIYKQDKN